MRIHLSIALLVFALAASGLEAAVTIVSPADGAQAIGSLWIVVETDLASVSRVEIRVDGNLVGVLRKPPYQLMFDFGPDLLPRTIQADVFSDDYKNKQRAVVRTAGATISESLTIDAVEVPVKIDSSVPPRAGDIQIRENGANQQIRELKKKRSAMRFVFLIDRSLSMAGGRFERELEAVDEFVRKLGPQDSAEIVLFNHRVERAVKIARGTSVRARFRTVKTSGGTSIRDAVASVAGAGPTTTIVISDGTDRNSFTPAEDALRKIGRANSTVYAVSVGESGRTSFLDRAASTTGGLHLQSAISSLSASLQKILREIESRYVVVYQSSATSRGWRTIEVASLRRGIRIVNARPGYFAE